MRVALIADIHGNLPALDAVLAEIDRYGVDGLVCLGDISIGPQPVETLERVRALDCPVIMGNWDAWFLEGMPEFDGRLGEVLGDLRDWAVERLSPEQRAYLADFVPSVEVPLLDGATHCFVAATVTRNARHPVARLIGDWLVLERSASHRAQETLHVGSAHHLALLNHPAVYERLRAWLAP